MHHQISEEWLVSLEEKLHLVSRKNERITQRLIAILAAVDDVCEKIDQIEEFDMSRKKKQSLLQKIKQLFKKSAKQKKRR